MKKSVIIDIIATLLMILFLYTGINKLMDYAVFKEQVAESPILSPIAPFVALGLPVIEILVAIMLLLPRWRLQGLYASEGLMTAFTLYVIAILSFSRNLPCSCGGILAELSWPQHLIFNIVFTLMALGGIKLERKNKKAANNNISLNPSGQQAPLNA